MLCGISLSWWGGLFKRWLPPKRVFLPWRFIPPRAMSLLFFSPRWVIISLGGPIYLPDLLGRPPLPREVIFFPKRSPEVLTNPALFDKPLKVPKERLCGIYPGPELCDILSRGREKVSERVKNPVVVMCPEIVAPEKCFVPQRARFLNTQGGPKLNRRPGGK